MFRAIVLPIIKSIIQSNAPDDGQNYCPKHVEIILIYQYVTTVASSWLSSLPLIQGWNSKGTNEVRTHWILIRKAELNELSAGGLPAHRPTNHWVFSYHKLHYTVYCSWWWKKLLPETCGANLNLSINHHCSF